MRAGIAVMFGSLLLLGTAGSAGGAGLNGGAFLHEEPARFLPGLYYFHKGCDYYDRGSFGAALDAWKIAAGWAVKDAQFDLGIAYFTGRGAAVDRPLGLAWLALAAERKDAGFSTSLALAWQESTPVEHERANEHFRTLRPEYGDESALKRAQNKFQDEIDHITGSRVGMPGHVVVWTPQDGTLDVVQFRERMQALALQNFGSIPQTRVDVGALELPTDAQPPPAASHD
jgi:hypothetical protein